MRSLIIAIISMGVPLILSAQGTVDMGTSTSTVSFNGNKDSLTLGSNNCTSDSPPAADPCTLSGSGTGTGIGSFDWAFTMPNSPTSPFTYIGEPSSITTTGTPTLGFSLSDMNGDSANGIFALTSLASDGGSGVDIDGNITIESIISGSTIGAFDLLFGLPSSTALDFVLDVGNCTSGERSEPCIQTLDPTAQFISLNVTPGIQETPEPGTFALLGTGVVAIFLCRRSFQKLGTALRSYSLSFSPRLRYALSK